MLEHALPSIESIDSGRIVRRRDRMDIQISGDELAREIKRKFAVEVRRGIDTRSQGTHTAPVITSLVSAK